MIGAASTPAPARAPASSTRVDALLLPLRPAGPDALATLPADERRRADRMRAADGALWGAGRLALRAALADVAGVAPGDIRFAPGPGGKPVVAAPVPDLRFGFARSGALALIALRLGHDVGADLEAIRDGVDAAAVAREVFGVRARAAFAELAGGDPRAGFFRAWVRHEALAKAAGGGIARPGAGDDGTLTVREIRGVPGFAAAVASAGPDWTLAVAAGGVGSLS